MPGTKRTKPFTLPTKIVKSTLKNPYPDGMRVYGRVGTKYADKYGVVISRRDCNLEGCRGLKLCVKWSDSRRTWPCTKGLTNHPHGMQIA